MLITKIFKMLLKLSFNITFLMKVFLIPMKNYSTNFSKLHGSVTLVHRKMFNFANLSRAASDHTFPCISSKTLQLSTSAVFFILSTMYLILYTTTLAKLTDKLPYDTDEDFLASEMYNFSLREGNMINNYIIEVCAQNFIYHVWKYQHFSYR